MLYPNHLQAALLFDRPVDVLADLIQAFLCRAEAGLGGQFKMVFDTKPGVFYRLFGADELMITAEYLDGPASMAAFEQSLSSAVTGIVTPDIRQRLARHRSHILLSVSHGVLGAAVTDSDMQAFLDRIGRPRDGHSMAQFSARLQTLEALARNAHHLAPASVVHWTQSNLLMSGEVFAKSPGADVPGFLHIHPYLFGTPGGDGSAPRVGIRTFGARHFIGREVLVEPHVLPWHANFQTVLALLRVAAMPNGYIIPNGDSFGPEDNSQSYRVVHHDGAPGDVPLIKLVPLLHREFGYQSPEYIPPERVFDDRSYPEELMPADQAARQTLVSEWQDRRAQAEQAGTRFEVRARATADDGPTIRDGRWVPPAFGRKRPG